MSGYGDAIASTSQAGQGDAVIFKSNGPGLSNNIRHYYDREGNNRQQQALQKQKFAQSNQQSFYKNIQDIKAKIWDADLEEINSKINDDILKYATEQQQKGIDVFSDPQSLVELNGKLGQLSALASASKSAQEIHNKTFQQGIADDWKTYDDAKSYSSLMEYKNLPIAQRALINPELKLRDFNAEEYINKNVSPLLLKDLQPLKGKVYNDEVSKQASEDAQNGIIDGYLPMVTEQLISTGRVNPEEATKIATDWVEKQKAAAFYDPTKNAKLAQDLNKHNDLLALRKAKLGLDRDKFEYTKKYNEPIPTNVTETMVGMAKGTVTSEKFYGVPISDPVTDSKGNVVKEPVYGKAYKADNGKSLEFEIIDKATGKSVGRKKIPVFNDKNEVVVAGSNVWQNINDDANANGISYGTELKSNSKTYKKPEPNYNPINKNQPAKTNSTVQQTTKMSVTEWNKKWSSLKKGEKLVGLDGKTYIKK